MKSSSVNSNLKNGFWSSTNVISKAEGIAFCASFSLALVLIVVGNLLIFVLFAVNRRLRRESLFLVINMAFADLRLGAVSLPLYMYSIGGKSKLWSEKWDSS